MKLYIRRGALVITALLLVAVLFAPKVSTHDISVMEQQLIMTKFGLPTGPVDGIMGPQTRRGLCSARLVFGMNTSRQEATPQLVAKIRRANDRYRSLAEVPAPTRYGHSTYMFVDQHCQVAAYVENGRYVRIMPVTTGVNGHKTPNGLFMMGYTDRGWHCSTLYPDCRYHTEGRFVNKGNYGNMYNRRHITGPIYVHGSTDIKTEPASHGCIRVSVNDSDWMWDHVGNHGPVPTFVVGQY